MERQSLYLHAVDCGRHGCIRRMVKTVDTDVLVIATGVFHQLEVVAFAKLCIALDTEI